MTRRLTACLIVKDEEELLPSCLESIRDICTEIIVVDTGSKDKTKEIARSFGAKIYEYQWQDDFAKARNFSLEQATGDWILYLDADETLLSEDKEKLKDVLTTNAQGYFVRILNLTEDNNPLAVETSISLRLFRNREEYRFTGSLHEQIAANILEIEPEAKLLQSDIRILHSGYLTSVVSSKAKKERNLALALKQVEENPKDPFMLFNLGVEYLRLKDYPQSVLYFDQAKKLGNPKAMWYSKIYKSYVLALLNQSNWQEALKLLDEGLEIYPDYTDLVFLQGIAYLYNDQYSRAVGSFYQCLTMGPAPIPPYGSAEAALAGYKAHYALAQTYEKLNKLAEAIIQYQQCFQKNSHYLQPLYHIAGILLKHEEDSAVSEYMEKFFNTENPNHLVFLADIFCSNDELELARKYLSLVQDDKTVTNQVNYLLGLCYLKESQYEKAMPHLKAVSSGNRFYIQAQIYLAYCFLNLGKNEEAEKVLDALPATQNTYAFLAKLFLQEAEKLLKEGLELYPESKLLQKELTLVQKGIKQYGSIT